MSNNFECDFCDNVFSTEIKLQHHFITHHIVTPGSCFPEADNDTETSLQGCQKQTKSCNESKITSEVHQRLTDYDSELETRSGLFEQDVTLEPNNNSEKTKYECDIFVESSVDSRKRRPLSAHRKHTKKAVKSTNSDSSTRKKNNVTTKTVLNCHLCGEKFTGKNGHSKLTYHLLRHAGEKPFKCSICSKAFTLKHRLQRHHRVVHEGKKESTTRPTRLCTVCNKEIRNGNVTRHMETHIDPSLKPFKCSACGKCYKHKRTLIVHLQTHAEEKPHVCDVCGRSFTRKYLLREHRAGHTGEKPFKCDLCRMCFRRSMDLKEHKRVQHFSEVFTENESGELQRTIVCFECSICGEKFAYQCRLNAHTARHKKQIDQAYITQQ